MTISGVLDQTYARLEHQLVQIAERVPGESYPFRPSPGVRTFGEQLRHIGAVQWVVGAGIQGGDPPVDVGDGDSGPISMLSKADILAYVQDSFTFIRRAISTIPNHNAFDMIPHPYDPKSIKVERLTLGVGYACHGWEHYGQLVVYGRLISQSGSPG
jgi:DinB superfamily